MRRFVSVLVAVMVVASLVPAQSFAAATPAKQQAGTITGVARGADKVPLRECIARLRSLNYGQLRDEKRCDESGVFVFTNVQPGNYVIEIADAAGKLVGMSPTLIVAAGAASNIVVTATAAGAVAAGTGGGFSLFGLGKLASVTVMSAAGAIAVAGVVATRENASPSR